MSVNLVSIETSGGELPPILQLMLGDGNDVGVDIHIRASCLSSESETEEEVRAVFLQVLQSAIEALSDDDNYAVARSNGKAAHEVAELEEMLAVPSFVNPFEDDVPPGSWGES